MERSAGAGIDREPPRRSSLADLLDRVQQTGHERSAHPSRSTALKRPGDETESESARARVSLETLRNGIATAVLAQAHAVEQVSRALVAPLNGLKLRPTRPHGVFLFNGPTGVGKTEMARAIADVVYGSRERLIVNDCSELGASASVNRLIGPPPGFVGHDNPGSWLTTRLSVHPESVVLFDEVEKAGPELWNLLLQICDSGRLTDARGNTASFSRAIVVLTGNIGAAQAMTQPVGFGRATTVAPSLAGAFATAVERALPPELRSRIDEIIQFEPLDGQALRTIARLRSDEFASDVSAAGWTLTIDDDVLDHVVSAAGAHGLGARQLERVFEREVLTGLVGRTPGCFRARVVGGAIAWELAEERP